jgi:hypothetical protein
MADEYPNPLYDTVFEMPVGVYFIFSGDTGYHFPACYAEEKLHVLDLNQNKG